VIVAGYSIYNGKTVFRSLAQRMDSMLDLQVTFLVHIGREGKDTTIETDLIAQYAKRFVSDNWPGQRLPEMYYDPRGLQMATAMRSNFHPKCLLVDGEEALVTSANFTMAAQKKNVEVGVKIKAPILVARLRAYFISLVERGDLKRVYLPTDSR
jgi:phosphatidylserine/phosphatidylglycerophosphate/cardiolipin synthase-like enzyme